MDVVAHCSHCLHICGGVPCSHRRSPCRGKSWWVAQHPVLYKMKNHFVMIFECVVLRLLTFPGSHSPFLTLSKHVCVNIFHMQLFTHVSD